LFPCCKFAWGESWPPLRCIPLLVPLGSEMASPTVDTGDLFPMGKVARRMKLASPTMDTGDLFPRSKVAWGVKLASPTMDTVDFPQ
jgi:hypothetical protein